MVSEINEEIEKISIETLISNQSQIPTTINENNTIPVIHGSNNTSERNLFNFNPSTFSYDRTILDCLYCDTRYFVIKSNNYENVMLAKHRGVWLTPSANENKLNTAYERHRNVILLFSVKESGRFSGIARLMTSSKPRDDPIPWVLPPSIDPKKLKNTFNIMWINKNDLFFSNCSHLTNPWNENKEVKIARDGQEIEPNLGKTLCQMFPPDPIAESCAIYFIRTHLPNLIPEEYQSHNSTTQQQHELQSNLLENNPDPDNDNQFKHEKHLHDNPYPTDIYNNDNMDFGSQLLESIINKSYDEYIESVTNLRKQMNLQALGIEKYDQFNYLEDLDPIELAEEFIKYYNSST